MLRKILWYYEGFTLTELLVTLMIIAVLFGLTTLSLQGLLVQAHSVGDEAERRSVEEAIQVYIAVDVSGGTVSLPARDAPAVIQSDDGDAPFAVYLQDLPTRCSYTWTSDGLLTQECP